MNDTAPKGTGIIAIAALFGVVAAGVAYVAYEYAFLGAAFIGLLVAAIVAILLMLGWREPAADPKGASSIDGANAGSGSSTSAAASASTLATTSAATPAAVAAAPAATTKPKAAAKPKAATKPKAPAKAAAAKAPARKPVSATGKPEMLTKARAGGADDLKEIKGVGAKMERMLNSMGVYHFDQVAGWRKKEVEWVDDNLEGFKGRVSRDNWVSQAKTLAKGGKTEFSKKVSKGGVYK